MASEEGTSAIISFYPQKTEDLGDSMAELGEESCLLIPVQAHLTTCIWHLPMISSRPKSMEGTFLFRINCPHSNSLG